MTGAYNPGLVALSVLIAIVASYAAFNLSERVSATGGPQRWRWLASGAIAMGAGIWSMHYVGMLAFVLPVPVLYHVPTVLLSLVAAVAGSAIAPLWTWRNLSVHLASLTGHELPIRTPVRNTNAPPTSTCIPAETTGVSM